MNNEDADAIKDVIKFPIRWPGGVSEAGLRISGRQELRKRSLDGTTIVWQNVQFVDSTEWVVTEIRNTP